MIANISIQHTNPSLFHPNNNIIEQLTQLILQL